MFLYELFASVGAPRRSTRQRTDEKRAEISRRLQELNGVTKPNQVQTPSTKARSENDLDHVYHDKTGT